MEKADGEVVTLTPPQMLQAESENTNIAERILSFYWLNCKYERFSSFY